jgi:mannitol/fructose-specific phosphotransferase system IIA component (Ntr-type)
MKIHRYLKPEQINLDIDGCLPEVPDPDDESVNLRAFREKERDAALEEFARLLNATGNVGNINKLHTDLIFREKKATTAMGNGIAIPHMRTMQATELILAFARSPRGLHWSAPDDQPVHMFFIMAAPPYDDKQYLKLYKQIAEHITDETCRAMLEEAQDPNEIIRILSEPTHLLRRYD